MPKHARRRLVVATGAGRVAVLGARGRANLAAHGRCKRGRPQAWLHQHKDNPTSPFQRIRKH